eukprot:CAMPEP_0181083056 /NCGR_PEP_ID=MMETSP1071-20121207/3955_1 /TAXON_ID=35127 /ORGANISM="Thalassiosira sp., Strain NH16" /LENGTH=414 /DNA_ID=CAMNT_0023164691 /DNA_START=72 /DNA_END=1316 /DNA_ORIENTATION=-
MKRTRDISGQGGAMTMAATTDSTASAPASTSASQTTSPPLYLAEGLLAVHKPLTWTSNDVVAYVRGILTRDARDRGYKEGGDNGCGGNNNRGRRGGGRRKKQMMKVGHGGTLDPLASGVLVLGVGKGTTMLQSYLQGDKCYSAACELGYETDTLDAEGKLVRTESWNHVESIEAVGEKIVPKFTGKIKQVPPLYSAIRIDGKRLYEIARKDPTGKEAEDVEIPEREVEIHGLEVGAVLEDGVIRSGVVDGPTYREKAREIEDAAAAAAASAAAALAETASNTEAKDGENKEGGTGDDGGRDKKRRRRNNKRNNNKNDKKNPFDEKTVPSILPDHGDLELPQFALAVRCGGGTYIRSLVRDIGYELGTVATMTGLVRTKQGPFVLEDALRREDWSANEIYSAIRRGGEKHGTKVE